MNLVSAEEVFFLHRVGILQHGGDPGVRDSAIVHSAVAQMSQTAFGSPAYPTLVEKAAALGHSLICNHPFIDGNKRAGLASMLLMLRKNHIDLDCPDDTLAEICERVAMSEIDRDKLAELLKQLVGDSDGGGEHSWNGILNL